MVRQHNSAGADSNVCGACGDITDQNRSGGARNSRLIMMLSQPKSFVAERLDVTGKSQRSRKSIRLAISLL